MYFNDSFLEGMRNYCTLELLNHVLDKVKVKENNHKDAIWSLTDFILSNKDDVINIMNVVLAFLYNGGYIIYNNRLYSKILDFSVTEKELLGVKFSISKGEYAEETQLIAKIKEDGMMSEEELGVLYDPWMKTVFVIRDVVE